MKRRNRTYPKKRLILLFIFCLVSIIYILHNTIGNYFSQLSINFSSNRILVRPYVYKAGITEYKNELIRKGFMVTSIEVEASSGNIKAVINNDITVLFSRYKDVEWQISSLHSITSRFTIENKRPKIIDFTYEKTIVNF